MDKETQVITRDLIDGALDYTGYRDMIKLLLSQGKTTGNNQENEMVAYTKMNDQRMNRWDKKIEVSEELTALVKNLPPMNWLVITEAWCGDAAQNIPFIAKLANLNDNINLKFILRDEHPVVMDNYLTNGGRSIPIAVLMDEDLNEVTTWGPRPEPVQKMVMAAKTVPTLDNKVFVESIHKWYADDKNQTIQNEFLALLQNVKSHG